MGNSRRPTPALFVALIALVVALAGTATALPGKNTVDKNDIKKNAVKSKAIKNSQVKAADIADGAVGSGEIADGGVANADLAATEPSHLVGAAGEPGFGNGVEGDCQWSTPTVIVAGIPDLNPASFYKDNDGVVHLNGVMIQNDAAGGDAACGPDINDAIAFQLPAGYIPQNNEVFWNPTGGAGTAGLIIGVDGLNVPGISVPAGAVLNLANADGAFLALDTVTFRAASAGTAGIEQPGKARGTVEGLKRALR